MTPRQLEYDGLRGVAALSVVVCHFVCTFYPALMFGSRDPTLWVADALSRSLLFAMYGGTFAVYVFYVLSGYVLAASSQSIPQINYLISRNCSKTISAVGSSIAR
jgi:peptidoglycan/LPS O-acetylase OafA/YrhL